MLFFIFFFKQKTAYEMQRGLVGSEMCIRDRNRNISMKVLTKPDSVLSLPHSKQGSPYHSGTSNPKNPIQLKTKLFKNLFPKSKAKLSKEIHRLIRAEELWAENQIGKHQEKEESANDLTFGSGNIH
eukprot:TRINITY_DN4890_c0_g1_i1.p1 TRINITY_DN4890_c0_g1~~TRINITY_DN4890_c0_g1_i1.p1  ORF type:complete len:127 (+),score=31.81 TRINITY_DN4890_c0_g1_i1:76-456(+)